MVSAAAAPAAAGGGQDSPTDSGRFSPSAEAVAAAEARKAEGTASLKAGDFEEAASGYGRAIMALCPPGEASTDALDEISEELAARLPTTAAVMLCNRCAANQRRNDLVLAESDARAAVSCDPSWFKTHLRLGEVLKGLGFLEEAKDSLEKALELEPGNRVAERLLQAVARASAAEGGDQQVSEGGTGMGGMEGMGGMGGMGGIGGMGGMGGFPGMGGMGGMPAGLAGFMSNPGMQQAAAEMMSNPAMQQMA